MQYTIPSAVFALAVGLCTQTALAQPHPNKSATILRPPPSTEPVVGPAQVVSASAIAIEGKRIVLFGIDPPNRTQPCFVEDRPWDCGTAAAKTLLNIVGREPVTCKPRAIDLFRRIFAVCEVLGKDINLAMIEAGMAVAERSETLEYVPAEEKAKAEKVGIWRGRFMMPDEFREMATGHPQGR